MKTSLTYYDHSIILILFLSIGLGPIFHFFSPVQFLTVSLFIVFIPFFILFVLFIKNLAKFRNLQFFLFISFMFFFILFLRSLSYNEKTMPLIIDNIYVLYIPMALMMFKYFDFTPNRSNAFLLIIKLFLIIYSLNSLFYIFGLPNINVLSDDAIIGSRFKGILGGSNVTANFIAILFAFLISQNNKLSMLQLFFFGSLAFFGVLPTLSKGAIFIVLLATVYGTFRQFKRKKLHTSFLITIFVVFLYISSLGRAITFLISFNERTTGEDLSSGRFKRIEFSYKLFSQDFQNTLIGIPSINQTSYYDATLSISDNSLLLISANFGIPFLILFFLFIRIEMRNREKISMNLKFFISIIIFVLLINNAVLYFQFCVFAIAGYYFIKSKPLEMK